MTEAEIIKGCIKQSRSSQEALYRLYYSKMMGICLRYAKSTDEAREILNEAFLTAFHEIRNIGNGTRIEVWLKEIIITTAIEHLKRNRHEYLIVTTVNALENKEQKEELADEEVLKHMNTETAVTASQKLSPAYRAVFNLYYIDGYTPKEIVEKLGTSDVILKQNLVKAKEQFIKNLSGLM